jgi:hypothetical protein
MNGWGQFCLILTLLLRIFFILDDLCNFVMNDISLEIIESNLKLVREALFGAIDIKVNLIEYRTFDEGLSTAHYFICQKADFNSSLAAFITLLNFEQHFYEEWNISETTQENYDSILENFLLPALRKAKFKSMTEVDVYLQTHSITGSIERLIKEVKGDSTKQISYPDRWGVYCNGCLSSSHENFVLPISHDIKMAWELQLEWNIVELFYETSEEYVLFSWCTCA